MMDWAPALMPNLQLVNLGCYHTVSDQDLLDDQEARQEHDSLDPCCPACCSYAERVEGYVLRLTRHPVTDAHLMVLQGIYGQVAIGTADIKFGEDPAHSVRDFIARLKLPLPIRALEVQAPIGVLGKLLQADLGIPLIRAQFERGEDGRLKVVGKDAQGRDLFKVIGYEQLVEVRLITHQL